MYSIMSLKDGVSAYYAKELRSGFEFKSEAVEELHLMCAEIADTKSAIYLSVEDGVASHSSPLAFYDDILLYPTEDDDKIRMDTIVYYVEEVPEEDEEYDQDEYSYSPKCRSVQADLDDLYRRRI